MAYGTVVGVEAHIPSAGSFGAATTPTDTEVGNWLTQASAVIDRYISSAGYTTPVSASTSLYSECVMLAELYASALALQALGLDVLTGDNQTKSQAIIEHVHDHLKSMADMDLTGGGGEIDPERPGGVAGRGLRTIQARRVDAYSRDAEESRHVTLRYPDQ